jgi:Family of unknown function (DUF6527)
MVGIKQIPWWEWWIPFRPWRIVSIVDAADEIPVKLPPRSAVLIGSLDRPKWIAFDCPCQTCHRIMITLDQSHRPHWKFILHPKLTLSPSVDYQGNGIRCHYFIRQGAVEWVGDSYGGYHGTRR